MNPLGTLFDRKIEICPFGSYVLHPEWDPPVDVATQVLEDRWTVEIAIPVEALGEGAGVESDWGFNFMRRHVRLRASSNFQTPLRYSSDHMALLQFK